MYTEIITVVSRVSYKFTPTGREVVSVDPVVAFRGGEIARATAVNEFIRGSGESEMVSYESASIVVVDA